MRKVKTFLHVFENSLFPVTPYYQKILRAPFIFSFKYFISLILLLNFIFLFYLGVKYNPEKIYGVINSVSESLSQYPADLRITIKDGLLISNYNRPYFLWLDYQNKKKLLLVIDENAYPEKIQIYKPLLLLTAKEAVIYPTKKNQPLSILPLTYLSDQYITKHQLTQLINLMTAVRQAFPLIYLAVATFALIIILVSSFIITLFYLVTATAIIVGIYKFILKKRSHFKKTFQIGLHAATLPLVLDYFLITFKPSMKIGVNLPLSESFFPISFLILLSIFIFAGTYVAYDHERRHRPSAK